MIRSTFSLGDPSSSRRGFGRMFPNLDPWPTNEDLQNVLEYIKFEDDIFGGMPAGYTYLGQFIGHDLSLDPSSAKGEPVKSENIVNFRTPVFDLDSMYGRGPQLDSFLYDTDQISFILEAVRETSGEQKLFWDVPRNRNRRGIVADDRNDENVIISQLLTTLKVIHNKFVEEVKNAEPETLKSEIFFRARQNTIWHYQWIVLYEYLGHLIDKSVDEIDELIKNFKNDTTPFLKPYQRGIIEPASLSSDVNPYYSLDYCSYSCSDNVFIPVEFSVAAFRFGHSQIRSSYNFNFLVSDTLFFNRDNRPNILVDWELFFFPKNEVQLYKKRNVSNLIDISFTKGFEPSPSLLLTDVERGVKMGLPSGQCIADKLRIPPLSQTHWQNIGDIFAPGKDPLGFMQNAPLWYYILAEAKTLQNGVFLGPVGAHIVSKTIIGLLLADKNSILNQRPPWKPKKIIDDPKATFKMQDWLEMNGVNNGVLVNTPS